MNIFSTLLDKYRKRKDIVNYWRSKGTSIGKNCEIYPSASFGSEPYLVSLGDHVRVNSGVTFVTHDGGVWVLRRCDPELKDIDRFGKIVICNNVHVRTNSIIMPGVTIGNNCIIGCGAIVTKDIPDNSIAVGVPARVIETIDEYRAKHSDEFEHTKNMSPDEKAAFLREKYK